MTTQARIEANRANAQHSTGPRTPQGKARCRHNALRHGLFSEQAVIATEDEAAYEEYCAALREELAPAGPWEQMLAEGVITHGWRLRRALWMETCLLDEAMEKAQRKDAEWRKGRWDAARYEARQAGRPEAEVEHPCPRAYPGQVDTAIAGSALRTMMYERSYLDVLRRYQRSSERGMHEAMRALQAARAQRRAGAGEEAATPPEENCGTDPTADPKAAAKIVGRAYLPDTNTQATPGSRAIMPDLREEDRATLAKTPHEENCGTDPTPEGKVEEAKEDKLNTQPSMFNEQVENCGTDPTTEGIVGRAYLPDTQTPAAPGSRASMPDLREEDRATLAKTPHEENCGTDPTPDPKAAAIAERERRIAVFRAAQRAEREKERRLGVSTPNTPPYCVRI